MGKLRNGVVGIAVVGMACVVLGNADAAPVVLSCGQTVTTSVTLAADLICPDAGAILSIGASGVTINLAGHTIQGLNGDTGIVDDGANGATIENGLIDVTGQGISLNGVDGAVIANLSFSGNNFDESQAVTSRSGVGNEFTKLTITGMASGVVLQNEIGDTILSNTVTGAAVSFADYQGLSDAFTTNNSKAETQTGYFAQDCSSDTFSGNTDNSSGNEYGFDSSAPAAPMTYTSNVVVSANQGFLLEGGQPYTVQNNTVHASGSTGIEIDDGFYDNGGDPLTFPGSTVTGNVVSNSSTGFALVDPFDVTFTGNRTIGDGDGFVLTGNGIATASISGNTATNNHANGFAISEADSDATPTFSNNVATGNGAHAISISDTTATPWTSTGNIGRGTTGGADCVLIACAPPTVSPSAPPSISGSAIDGQQLTGSRGIWAISTNGQTYSYEWFKCDANGANCVQVGTGLKRTLGHGDVGSNYEFVVIATDDNGTTQASALSGVVTSAPPRNTGLPVIGGFAGQVTLTGTTGSWTGGTPPITYTKQWQRCNSGGCTDIAGATANAYWIVSADIGSTIRLKVTGTSTGGGAASAFSAPTDPITGIAPTGTAGTIADTTTEGKKVTITSYGTWSGTRPIALTEQWLRCDLSGTACNPIAGATGTSYTLTGDDVGSTIKLEITGTTPAGSMSVDTNATDQIVVVAPSNTSLPTISGALTNGSRLTAHVGTWTGSPATSIGYQWIRCTDTCNPIQNATAVTYVVTQTDEGATFEVDVTESNSGGSNDATSTATTAIQGSPPAYTVAPSISATPTTPIGIKGAWTGVAPITFQYQWFLCDSAGDLGSCVPISGAASTLLHLIPAYAGKTVVFLVTATNADGQTPKASAAFSVPS